MKRLYILVIGILNKRILFVYIYDDYKGKSEYKEIINLGENFADRLFMLNK